MTNPKISIPAFKLPRVLTCLTLFALAGCDSDDAHDEVIEALMATADVDQIGDLDGDIFEIDMTPEGEQLGLQAPHELELLARVERRTSSVEWRGLGSEAEVVLVISGTAEDTPLLDMDTAESLTPIEAWVAIADEPSVVPERLLERATPADLALLTDTEQIDALRARVRQGLESTDLIQAQGLEPHTYGTCTSGQISVARSVYGQSYTSASTCGDHLGFNTATRNYTYCNGGSCNYALGTQEDSCTPSINNSSTVNGSLTALTMRAKTGGNPNFVTGGHRIRGLAYNCHGNGSLNLHLEYGPYDHDVLVGSGYYAGVLTLGGPHLPANSFAIHYVNNGQWNDDASASGSTYLTTKYRITNSSAPGDFGIFCTDAQKSLNMSAGPTGNAYEWCTSYGNCDYGNCWDQ